ncbi:sigma-70 family RNA polymerase sigma factor [Chitinophaga arvensicola]|uniref:RNA polymerase sigma-70 factor, ECF subfamily n=1 Tax=Chitinophaga arvensicola TaxID=29529 RepID=A0A1I0S844_9BACT|nr:sigma-70 family RNA polymerase sigma factor [Chitinophaga arvensicola]SEW52029.1 RNA polymerase sigma-70 factor, ECF subfamily [Chitinophaga arvensicola]
MMTDYSHYADDELVQLMSKDDHNAFTEIYNRYWKRLYVLAYDRLRSRELAEDVVQDVLTGLWQRRNHTVIRSLPAYLATANRYAVFSQFSKMVPVTAVEALPEAIQAVADDTAEVHFLEQSMQEQLKQLPEKCRLVFDYSRNKGLSNREIATELKISEKAVEKHITKALQRLRLQFRNYFHSLFV